MKPALKSAVRRLTGQSTTPQHDPTLDTAGTSYKSSVNVSYERLVEVFGEPGEGDGYKVAFAWQLKFSDGTIATIYDYKSTSLYDEDLCSPDELKKLPENDWHIGGSSQKAETHVLRALGLGI